ncbi:MAG: pyruvate kinase alpha/beta domain-containing protein [Thermoanaerobaculia bacterium]
MCLSARTLQSEAVISSAHTGEAVREIAYYRPRQSIIAITEDVLTAVRLLQHRGVYPVVMEHPISRTVDEFIDIANQIHRDVGIPVPEKERTKRSFRIPGLLRIESAVKPVDVPTEIPNSLHEFTLPVKPAPTPEIERKYVLTAATHRRLTACLKRDAMAWQLIRQQNLYFTDSDARLEQARVMVRLRVEKLLDRSDGEADEPRRVLLTIKARAMRRADGFEERDEQEFDVTRDYLGVGEIAGLSPTCSRYVADHCGELLQPYRDAEVQYRLRGATTNDRLRCAMYNSFVLELDESVFDPAPFGTEHELEIEFRGNDNVRHELEEYVHDKFARLDISIVNDYPSKLQRAYCYADLLGDRTAPTFDLIRASRDRIAARCRLREVPQSGRGPRRMDAPAPAQDRERTGAATPAGRSAPAATQTAGREASHAEVNRGSRDSACLQSPAVKSRIGPTLSCSSAPALHVGQQGCRLSLGRL